MRYSALAICFILISAASSTFGLGYRPQLIGPTDSRSANPYTISETGVVAGSFMDYSIDPERYEHAFVWSTKTGTVDLGRGSASAINDNENVTGVSNQRATLWNSNQTSTCLGTLGDLSYALAINDQNLIVGYSYTTYNHAFRWDPTGGFKALEDSDNYCSMARAVNQSGQIAGYAATKTSLETSISEACIWDSENKIHKIGTLGGQWSEAYSLNDLGQVVGVSETSDHNTEAFIWDAQHGMQGLGFCSATDINDLGQIIGWRNDGPFMWQDGKITYLDAPAGYIAERAYSINNSGQIVGTCRASDGTVKAILWEPVPEPSCFVALTVGCICICLRKYQHK